MLRFPELGIEEHSCNRRNRRRFGYFVGMLPPHRGNARFAAPLTERDLPQPEWYVVELLLAAAGGEPSDAATVWPTCCVRSRRCCRRLKKAQ